jgi:hypothetical protein
MNMGMMHRLATIGILLFLLAGFASPHLGAQEPAQRSIAMPPLLTGVSPTVTAEPPANICDSGCVGSSRGFLDGNHDFDRFIGFMSNLDFNIDPRAVTELWPAFGSTWTTSVPALPDANIWFPGGAGINVALSERFSIGLNQGGYMLSNFSKSLSQSGLFADRFGRIHNRLEFSGKRDGWLNVGTFGQYTLIQDASNQFLLTTGLRLVVPVGSSVIFQGHGPAVLAPYVAAGKEFGDFHVLANVGYNIAAGSGGAPDFFYGCLHLDRRCFDWLYPLVEFNWIAHTSTVHLDVPTRFDFIDFGNFDSTGNLLTMAVGANAVLIPSKLELGAVYTTSLATAHNFSFNGFLVKMIIRY